MITPQRFFKILPAVILLLFASIPALGQMTVTLSTTAPATVWVGTAVVWTATATPPGSTLLYRFSTSASGGNWNVTRDYGPANSLPWTSLRQGIYNIRVDVLDAVTGETAEAQVPITFRSRVTSPTPVVSKTQNPLVALYSAPPCPAGTVSVSFWPTNGGEPAMTTSAQTCIAGVSLNFHLAGMLPRTTYSMQQQIVNGSNVTFGPILSFTTGSPSVQLPVLKIAHSADSSTSTAESILLTSFVGLPKQTIPLATDLQGNPLWYYVNINDPLDTNPFVTRTTNAPSVLMLFLQGSNRRQVLREVDLAGNLIRETDTTALNLQLTAIGQNTLNWLSHEAIRLGNGHTVILGSTERLLTDVQGPGTVDVVGDLIVDLDQNFQVAWVWNAFDFLDTSRGAVLGETCVSNMSCGGPLFLASQANDWTHCNSLQYLAADGSLAVSCRNQDMVYKINYGNGTGDGSVLWRLGKGGDFTITSTDPWPWFSHQHDVEFDGTNYTMFDDGNTRISQNLGGNSRGYVLAVDESAMTANPVLLADLGAFSQWWGSAQLLSNGNYHFLSGCLGPLGVTVYNCIGATQPQTARSIEILPNGTFNFNAIGNAHAYRSFRLKDLYTP